MGLFFYALVLDFVHSMIGIAMPVDPIELNSKEDMDQLKEVLYSQAMGGYDYGVGVVMLSSLYITSLVLSAEN